MSEKRVDKEIATVPDSIRYLNQTVDVENICVMVSKFKGVPGK